MRLETEFLAYDFSQRSQITLIFFDGMGGTDINLRRKVEFYQKLVRSRLKAEVNVVCCRDYVPQERYAAYFNGLVGISDSLKGLGIELHNLLYAQNKTERLVAFGDCAGSIPIVATSDVLAFHSMNFTNPYLQILDDKHDFTVKDKQTFIGRDTSVWIHDNFLQQQSRYNGLPFLEEYVKSGGVVNMHWALSAYGTDLMFRDQVRHLERYPNVKVVDHPIPETYNAHSLIIWLSHTNQYLGLVLDSVEVELAALTKNTI